MSSSTVIIVSLGRRWPTESVPASAVRRRAALNGFEKLEFGFKENGFLLAEEPINFQNKLEGLIEVIQSQPTDEDLANQISLDISRSHWHSILSNTGLVASIGTVLVFYATHNVAALSATSKSSSLRVKRFAEAFFCQELSLVHLLAVYDPNTVGHEALAADVRQSPYFQQLPSLPVSCRELDGDTSTLPIIFEDIFLSPTVHDSKGHYPNGSAGEPVKLSQAPPPGRGDSSVELAKIDIKHTNGVSDVTHGDHDDRKEPINFQNKLEGLIEVIQSQPTDEDLANQISLDISRLSSQNTVLLRQLGKSCVLQPKVAAYLRRKTHQLRDHLAVARTPSRSSGTEAGRSIVLPSNSVTEHRTKACTVAVSANLTSAHTHSALHSPTHPRLFWRTHERYHPKPVALGTLSRPPFDPPGGCVPRARLNMSMVSTTGVRTHGLSVSLSLPNLLQTRSLARVNSDSVLESSSPAKKYQTAKRLDRKLKHRSGRHSKPGSRLAYLGSCSDLSSTLLAENRHLRNSTTYRPYSSSQHHLSSSSRPVSRSVSAVCPNSSVCDMVSPLRRSADSDVPNLRHLDLENSELEPRTSANRNNAGRWINQCWSSAGPRRSSEWRISNSSGSSPVEDAEQKDVTQPLGSMTTPSSTMGHASAPVLSSHLDPAVNGDVHRGLSVDSVSRPDQTRSGSTGSLGFVGLTVKSLSENRLMECGYQVLENEVSDDDGVASDELKQEKMSILELLRHEAKRYDSYENTKALVHKHDKQPNPERGTFTYEMKHFSKSSPALPELGIPRVSINLPPVLRYIGQNRRRLRRSSYHGRRSIHLIRSRGPSVIVDPISQGSVQLLGYRSLVTDEDSVDDSLLMLSSDTPIPRPPLPASRFSSSHLTDVSGSTRLCRARTSLASRE
ncbi:hypothetical protein AHF37_06413 [Paragonimus kellicotti]|nr:hypothetical protein AHF37_06413 [Paragonimus kellicotti]